MAKSKVDPCMFCGEAPCVCNKPAPKPVAKKRVKAEPIVEHERPAEVTPTEPVGIPDPPKSSFKNAMKARAALAPPPPPPPPVKQKPKAVNQRQVLNEDDVLMNAAIRALGPLLREDEREKYRVILTSEPTAEERKIIWKVRRRESATDA